MNWILCSLSFNLSYLLIFNFYEFPIKFHIAFTHITWCSHCHLLLNCVSSAMTVSLSYLKAMSLPPKHTHTQTQAFLFPIHVSVCSAFILEGGQAAYCQSFYGTVIRKHNLFALCFLKIYWLSLWHKTSPLWGTIPCIGKAYILLRSRLRSGNHWIPTAIFSLQNYTLFLQRIWFILLWINFLILKHLNPTTLTGSKASVSIGLSIPVASGPKANS